MKIRQQKQIKAFLAEAFGPDEGKALFHQQEELLCALLIESTKNKSKKQIKTLTRTILPRIALYKILSQEGISEEERYEWMRKYMQDKVAVPKHASIVKMESVPGFYAIYSSVFLNIMRTTDLQENTRNHGRDFFDVTIQKCLWYTACVENDCAELCRLFCDVDDVTYGGLKKIGFTRTKTFGYGGDCCDFHFYKK